MARSIGNRDNKFHLLERISTIVTLQGSSIKFDDKVETIPVERPKYAQPTSPKQYQAKTKPAPPGPPAASSLQQPNADFYAAAMQAAYKKVYGERDQAAIGGATSPTSSDFHPSSPPQQSPPQVERQHSGRKSKFGFIPLTLVKRYRHHKRTTIRSSRATKH